MYAIAPGATLAGERPVTGVAASGALPQPVAFAYTVGAPGAPTSLTIRWAGEPDVQRDASQAVSYWYGANPGAVPIADYTFTAQALDARGQPVGAPIVAGCQRLEWSEQLSLVTTMRLPASLTSSGVVASWRVSAQAASTIIARPTLGPVTLETGGISNAPAQGLGAPVTFAAPLG